MNRLTFKSAILASAIGFSLVSPRANAVVFHDPIHTLQNIITQLYGMGSDAAEYGEQLMRWRRQLQEFQRYIAKLQGFASAFNIPYNTNMQKVPVMWGVEQHCGSSSMLNPRELLNSFSLNPEGNVLQQQRDICARIQIAKNEKYNYTVEFMETIKPNLEAELRQLRARRDTSSDPGDVSAASGDNGALSNNIQLQFQTWEAQMNGYDAYIVSMEDSNRVLAQSALKGKKGALTREVIKTLALKRALGQ